MQTSRIFKRGETFYYRRRIPPALRKSKSHSIIISLKTSDANQAERLALWYDVHFNNLITRERMQRFKINPSDIMHYSAYNPCQKAFSLEVHENCLIIPA